MVQEIVVFIIVAAAVIYICRMVWNAFFGKGGCHSCSANHTSSGPRAKLKSPNLPQHLIQMQTSPRRDGQSNGTTKPQ